MVRACPENDHASRLARFIRKGALYTGVSAVAVAVALVVTASPAEAVDDIDLDAAASADIEDHITELEAERAEAAELLAGLQVRLAAARAVVEEAAAEYGSADVQLDRVTVAVDAAEDHLGAKMASVIEFAREQSDKFDEAREAAERSAALTEDIAEAQDAVDELDGRIEQAREAAERAAEAEAAAAAEAEARAREEAEAEAEAEAERDSGASSPGTDSGSSPSTASYSSDAATAAVQFALDQVGEPYVFGAAGPDAWDCSGLVKAAYAVSGISLTHYTVAMWNETSPISRSDLRPGDLVFYAGLGHMAMYLGGGEVVHAPKPGDVVKVSAIDMMGIEGYRRV